MSYKETMLWLQLMSEILIQLKSTDDKQEHETLVERHNQLVSLWNKWNP